MGLTAWDMLVIFTFSGVWMKGDFQGSMGIEYDPSICLLRGRLRIESDVPDELSHSYYLLNV